MASEVWTADPHQIELSDKAYDILKEHGLVYLAMEERTGKSITALRTAEKCENVDTVFILSTKKALDGWKETLAKFPHDKVYILSNYHSSGKLVGKAQLVILDEAHNYISGYPKTSKLYRDVYSKVYGLPIIYSSATPHAEGPQLLFHQFKLSKWSPWKRFPDFYAWFKFYADRKPDGELRTTKISATQTVIDYTKIKTEEVLDTVKHLFVTYTRKQAGFEHEPEDVLHYVELLPQIKEIYNTIVDKKVLAFTHSETGKDYVLICDSASKMRWALHMLEGGTLKIDNEYINLGNNEKADYILKTWGDTEDLVIMYHFKADEIKLSRMFKKARILQSQTFAEGVDLSMYKDLVIYSQNHSAAKHSQRRARQANRKRKEPINVHYILVKRATSDKAYRSVSIKKQNFIDTVFERI